MKRPLAVAGITMLVTMSVLCLAESPWLCVAVSAAVILFLFIHLIRGRGSYAAFAETVLISISVSCLLVLAGTAFVEKPAIANLSEKRTVQLEITDYPTENNGRYYFRAKLLGSDSLLKPNVRLSLSKSDELADTLGPGDKIEYTGKVYRISEKVKAVQRSYQSKKILLGTYPFGKITLTQKGRHGLLYLIKNERRRVKNIVLKSFEPDTAGLVIAVLFGDKSFISDETYSHFKSAGVAHIMAVSGLHLSIWILFVMRAVGFTGFDERKAAVVLLGFTVLIMAFADFSGSVMRAGFMMLLYLLGQVIGKQTDPLDSLGFSAVVILILNPYACLNLSFLLSFSATFAIIVFVLPVSQSILSKLRPKIGSTAVQFVLEAVIDCVLTSFFVSLFTLPISALSFGYLSTVGILGNLMLLPLITVFVVFSGFAVIFYAVPVISDLLIFMVSACAGYFIKAVSFLDSSDFSVYRFRFDTVWLWVVFIFAFFVLMYIAIRKERRALYFAAAVFLLVSLPTAALADSYRNKMSYCVTVYDIENGLAVSVTHRKDSVLLMKGCDSYQARFVQRSLQEQKCPVTFAVVLGQNADAAVLLNGISAERIVTQDRDLSSLSPENREKVFMSDSVSLDENCRIRLTENGAVMDIYGKQINLAEELRESDVLITDNPEITLDNLTKSDIIVSSQQAVTDAFSTANDSDITIWLEKSGNYTLKGENEWRYLMKSS
ncbi:MAG: ComEC/Rec2 family competence protein [Acutalibacteraceae bacterium]